MANFLDDTESGVRLVLMVGLAAGLVYAAWYLKGLFGDVDPKDPTGAKAAVADAKQKVNDWSVDGAGHWRDFLSGTTTDDAQTVADRTGTKAPDFAWTDFLPNWLNSATGEIEPEQVSKNDMGGDGVTGTW